MAFYLDLDPLHSSTVLTIGAIALLYIILSGLQIQASDLPHGIVWAGCRKEIFSRLRACMRSHSESLQWLTDGYNTLSRKGVAFVIPTSALRAQVMLPQEHISWLVDQSDSVLSVQAIRKKGLAIDWLLPAVANPLHDMFLYDVVRRDLPRNLGKLQPDMFQEMRQAIEGTMGMNSDDWHEICLCQTMRIILKRVSHRVLFGLPLSQDAKFGSSLKSFAGWFGTGAFVAGQLAPWPFRPILATLAAVPIYIHMSFAMRAILPEVNSRIESLKRKRGDASRISDEPQDFMTWYVVAVLDSGIAESLKTPEAMAHRLLLLSLATDHSMNVSIVNVFLDLLSADSEQNYYQQLSSEADAAFPSPEDWSTPTSVTKLPLADSAIRESLRRNPINVRGMLREVAQKDGVTLPNGTHLPKGAWIGTPMLSVHYDERFYSDPEEYKPFRFERSQGQATLASAEIERGVVSDKASEYRKSVALPTTSDIFMTWGHGRHACPGRWFAAHLLKMMLAYITLNYDIESLSKRPLNDIHGDFNIPPRSASIKVRRRKGR